MFIPSGRPMPGLPASSVAAVAALSADSVPATACIDISSKINSL